MAGSTTYQVTVDSQQAIASLQRLNDRIKTVNDSFSKFNQALSGLAVGAFIASSYKMAAALSDISEASGVALQSVIGFGQAVTATGGNIDAAGTAITKLSQKIDDAAKGNKEAQSLFMKLGVTLNDLATLSEEDILRKTIDGLARMSDNAARVSAQVDLFGKSFARVNVAELNNQLDGFVQRAGATTEAVAAANRAEENFSKATQDLQIKILAALEPISQLAANMLEAGSVVSKFIDVVIEVGKVVLVFTAIGKAAQVVSIAFRAVWGAIQAGIAAGAGLIKTFELVVYQLGKVFAAGEITGATIAGLTKRFAAFTRDIPILGKALAVLGTGFYAAWSAAKKFFGLGDEKLPAPDDGSWNRAEDARNQRYADAAKAREEAVKKAREVVSAVDAETAAITKQVAAYQQSISQSNTRYQLQTQLIGASEKQRLLQEELQQAEAAYLQAIQPLLEEYAKKKASANAVDQAMLPRIQQALKALSQAYSEQVKVIEENTAARARANEVREFELYQTRQLQQAEDDLKKVYNETVRGPLTEIERKYYEIADAAEASALAAIRAEEARRGEKLSPEEIKRYYDTARQGAERLQQANKKLSDSQRTFAYGWKKAFKEYVDDATNAAKQAERMFSKFTQGLEDLIVDFAKTGKFEWRKFAESMAEEMLRSNVRSLMAQLGTSFGLGDLFGGGGAGAGQGSTPTNPLYVKDVSGGAGGLLGGIAGGGSAGGGGLLGSIAGLFGGKSGQSVATPGINPNAPSPNGTGGSALTKVMSSVGNVVGSAWEGIKSVGTSIYNGVSSVASSIGSGISSAVGWLSDTFGGFFANGGSLPRGKWGIAGEAGPELIQGPASITPAAQLTGGGTTNVTYNINAVDARSFQQLLAQDPSFIFALTEQGRKSFAGGR